MGNCLGKVDDVGYSSSFISVSGKKGGINRLHKEYKMGNQIGKGHYGKVYRGVNKTTGQEVAIKVLERSKSRPHRLRLEVDILRKIGKHDHIVELLDVFEDKFCVILVFELMEGGELFDRLINYGAYDEAQAALVTAKLASALHYIHGLGIVHRDLKPENLLLSSRKDKNADVKLADFGLSRMIPNVEGAIMTTVCGTWAYSAPEVRVFRQPYSHMIDLWSLGVLLYVFLSGYHPFDPEGCAAEEELQRNIRHRKFDFDDPVWESVSQEAKDLICNLLQTEVEKRLDMMGVLQHPWIQRHAKSFLEKHYKIVQTKQIQSNGSLSSTEQIQNDVQVQRSMHSINSPPRSHVQDPESTHTGKQNKSYSHEPPQQRIRPSPSNIQNNASAADSRRLTSAHDTPDVRRPQKHSVVEHYSGHYPSTPYRQTKQNMTTANETSSIHSNSQTDSANSPLELTHEHKESMLDVAQNETVIRPAENTF